jgi:hypothetical protein
VLEMRGWPFRRDDHSGPSVPTVRTSTASVAVKDRKEQSAPPLCYSGGGQGPAG